MISVTDYGATPDDSSDDTQAFRDAFDAAGDNGTVTVPEGTFTVSATPEESYSVLQITPGRLGISLVGAGPDKTRIRLTGGHTHNQVFCKHEEDYNHDGAEYRNLTLDGNGANQNDDPGFGVLLQSQGDNDVRECPLRGLDDQRAHHARRRLDRAELQFHRQRCRCRQGRGA
jgi:hypothetical protein